MSESGTDGSCCSGVVTEDVALDAAFLARFHDITFEAWRAVPWNASMSDNYSGLHQILNPAYSEPYQTLPATMTDGDLTASFDLRHMRTTRWLVFLTGVGPDGVCYRLEGAPDEAQSVFTGTVWDWLTRTD